ncbi:restriction endonuclease subunit S [Streptococcus dentapri]|uniref:Restriction endonuclease subunit S n=1 Tax=Streptococcus dentapri TaxID=573564 RepID=A0ABV8D137_9STRE
MTRVSKLRFSDFTNAWEQRKLGEVADFTKGKGYSKNDLIEKGSSIVLYGRLYTNYETVITDVDTFVNEQPNSVISKGNEVIVPASGESPEDIARASAIRKTGIILGGDLNIVYPKKQLRSEFLALTISNGKPQKELVKRAQGKSVVHIRNSDLEKVVFSNPTLPEQEAIGTFFRQLDELLTLHQRK